MHDYFDSVAICKCVYLYTIANTGEINSFFANSLNKTLNESGRSYSMLYLYTRTGDIRNNKSSYFYIHKSTHFFRRDRYSPHTIKITTRCRYILNEGGDM